jgi:hypothetical protein
MIINPIIRDLGNRFEAQLIKLLGDTADTMLRGGVSDRDAAGVILSILMQEAGVGAIACGLDEKRFAVLAVAAHKMAGPKVKRRIKEYAEASKASNG